RFQAEAVADGFSHVGLVLDDQHAHARMLVRARIVGVSKNRYALATPRWEGWRRGLWKTIANDVPSDSDSQDTRRGAPRLPCGDRRRRPPVAGVLVLERHVTRRRRSQGAPWWARRSAAQHGVAGTRPGRIHPNRTIADPGRP